MTVNNKYKEFVKKLDEKSNSNSDNYDLTETLDSLCKKSNLVLRLKLSVKDYVDILAHYFRVGKFVQIHHIQTRNVVHWTQFKIPSLVLLNFCGNRLIGRTLNRFF